jgi:uncharacterized membrane protein YphA (DoxX/SURF4 family)
MTERFKQKILLFLRILAGMSFTISGIAKLNDLRGFAETLYSFGMEFRQMNPIIATALSTLELLIGLCLVFELYIRFASLVAVILLLAFISAIVRLLLLQHNVECGCFGEFAPERVDTALLLRDIALMVVGLVVFKNYRFDQVCD